jgi:hypothetical protein
MLLVFIASTIHVERERKHSLSFKMCVHWYHGLLASRWREQEGIFTIKSNAQRPRDSHESAKCCRIDLWCAWDDNDWLLGGTTCQKVLRAGVYQCSFITVPWETFQSYDPIWCWQSPDHQLLPTRVILSMCKFSNQNPFELSCCDFRLGLLLLQGSFH